MTETILIFIIAGAAFALSARWFYRTVAGKPEGCGCGESGCATRASTNRVNDKNYCEEA
ncbi:MAG: hypothetical protein JSU80_13315 [Deltaproteobacteria bacterium]|nr:MAG: hypothetical protein JSU80_13315 [Deltaproteobacteria bacterium]